MSKKILGAGIVMVLVAAVLVGGSAVASAQSMSLCQTVDALVLAGVIAPDKVAAAKAAAGCSVAAPASAYTFTRDLTLGSTGADVTALQNFLVSNGNSIPAGATGYFGAQTKAALAAYQAAKGIAPASGYFGPLTRASVNANTVVVAPVTPVTPVTPSNDLDGGAGSIEITASSEYKDEEVAEGASDVEVLTVSVEADDESDVEVTSIKISLENTPTGDASNDLDDYADSVSVWFNGKEVGSADVDDFSENDDVWTKSISLDGAIVRAGEEEDITIAVTALNVIDSEDTAGDAWNIDVVSARFVDAEGVTTTETPTGTVSKDFDFANEGEDEDLVMKSSSSDPDSAVLLVEEDDESDWHEVFAFKIKAEDGDIDLEDLVLTVTTGSEDYDVVVSDAMITIDGEDYTVDSVDDEDSKTADLTFEIDGDFTIDADETVEVVVSLEFRAQEDAYVSGAETVQVKTVSISGEGVDDVSDATVITGEVHTLAITVAEVTGVTGSSSKNEAEDIGYFAFAFTVEAGDDEDTVFTASETPDGTDSGLEFTITGGDATVTATLVLIDGDAEVDGDEWTVAAGDEAEFALDITVTSDSDAGAYRAKLETVAGVTIDKLVGPVNLVD